MKQQVNVGLHQYMCNIFSCCITAPDCVHDYFKSLPITFIILNGIASFENVAVTVLSDEKENIKGVALSIYLLLILL